MEKFLEFLNTPAGQNLIYAVAGLIVTGAGLLAKRQGVKEAEFSRWLSSAEKLGSHLTALSRMPMAERRTAAHELAKTLPLNGEEVLHLASDAAAATLVAEEAAEIKNPNTSKKKLSRAARGLLKGLAGSYIENELRSL